MNSKLIQILKNLVKIPTENPPGKTDEIIDYLISNVFEETDGFHNEILSYKKKDIELKNLITKIGSGNKNIVLSGHLDVVPAGDHSKWTYPPFSAEVVDNKLYGRGACDMKGGLVMLIGTLMNLKENTQLLENYTLQFIGSADEEAGMTGAYTCVRKDLMKNSIFLVIGEPTNMKIGIAEKGLLWADIYVHGKAGHASTPNIGINSIEGAMKVIPQLYDCLDNVENPVLGKSTLNIGKIYGGIANNIVPDKTILSIDYRYIPEQDFRRLYRKVHSIKADPCKIEIKVTQTLPALQTDIKHQFIQNLSKISGKRIIGLPYATDAGVLVQRKNPVPFLIYGPGNPEVVHKPDEYINLNDIDESVGYLTNALFKTFGDD